MPPPAFFRHGMPVYPTYTRRNDDFMDGYYPVAERSNGHGHGHRHRERGSRSSPPPSRDRFNRR